MRTNFRKVAAIASSILMLGMSVGVAAAANFPAPFVVGGTPNVAIVYGSGAATSDATAAQSIANDLNGFVSGGSVSVSGEAVALDRGSSSRIWLNTSLTTAQSIFTKTDLPTILADSTFNGDVSATISQQVTLGGGQTAGGDNSGKVIFSKQPTSSVDPSVGLSLGADSTNPAYNATVNFNNAVNFTDSDSHGQVLTLFGKDYTVSSDSSLTNGLVLFQSAQTVTLTQGGTSGSASATVSIDGTSHTVELVNAGTTSATIAVDGTSQSVNVGSSRTINGVSIAVTSVQSSNAGGNTATVLVGAKKLNFKNGQQVTTGDNNQAILGTLAYIGGNVNATTSLTVAVYAQDTSHDWVGKGDVFADPVFGSFAISNNGLNSDLTDSSRDTMKVGTSGSTTLTLQMTDKLGNSATFDWATNKSSKWNLSTSNGYNIYPYEMANLSLNDYTLTGTGANNQNPGEMLELQSVYNDTSTYTADYAQFYDPIRGTTVKTGTPTSEGVAPLTIDGRQYTVYYVGTAGSSQGATAQIKYSTADSAATDVVVFPTIMAQGGESVGLYAPTTINLGAFNGTAGNAIGHILIPNGNGFTTFTITPLDGNGTWSIAPATGTAKAIALNVTAGGNYTTMSVGQLTYNFTESGTANKTTIYLTSDGTTNLAEPGLVIFQGKDESNAYQAVIIDTTALPAGTSSNGVGVNGVYFSGATKYGSGTSGVQLYSNSNLQQYIDRYGTLVTKDSTSSSQPTATISYPAQQAYEQLYLGATDATTTNSALGNVLVTDSEVGTVSSKNLIVVGGSCINSAAASLVGGAYCGSAWTSATGVGSGQFLIKSYPTSSVTSQMALLVAGYEAADTTNAATYLTTKTVDTSKGGIGTTSTGSLTSFA